MKKAALTFALISTVIVATSFSAPQVNSENNSNKKLAMHIDPDSQYYGQGKRKQDIVSQDNFSKSEGFRQDRQAIGITKKID